MDATKTEAWIQTASGRAFSLTEPAPADVDLQDIASALSKIARFGGHTRRPYSVAQHCCLVASIVPAEFRLHALLHDAAEAYVGDIVTPLKRLVPLFSLIETRVHRAICRQFRITEEIPVCVLEADRVALATEVHQLLDGEPVNNWTSRYPTPLAVKLPSWESYEAAQEYAKRVSRLLADRERAREFEDRGVRPCHLAGADWDKK
jgi:5'-deoxynucleotidase YfbR-like HD superfamily hydrolase